MPNKGFLADTNYDVPWNPARLEQRMGRIHRYGQTHDPVVIVNLIAGETREGRVLGVLLDKLERIRRELQSDKVFDVVGRLIKDMELRDYLEKATTEDGASSAIKSLDSQLSAKRVTDQNERERGLYGSTDLRGRLPEINAGIEQEQYRRVLPGYVRRFVETAAPLIGLRLQGDASGVFEFAPSLPGASDSVPGAMDTCPESMCRRMTFYRPASSEDAVWMHPGEPVFDNFRAAFLARWSSEAKRGAVFVDPHAEAPYLFHMGRAAVVRRDGERAETIEISLVGLRQEVDGTVSSCPPEQLLLLRGTDRVAPGSVPLARSGHRRREEAEEWLAEAAERMATEHRARIEDLLPERRRWAAHGYDHRIAELMAQRQRLSVDARRGDADAQAELASVKVDQGRLATVKRHGLERLEAELSLVEAGETAMIVHALVVPADTPDEVQRHDAEVEAIAMDLARAHEEAAGANVRDVSRPELARREGLGDWPGFDLRSLRPADAAGLAEDRAIEVKGRAGTGSVEVKANEWAAACNLRDRYWLYVVFDCATSRPRLVKVRDPFGCLLAKSQGVVVPSSEILASGDQGEA